MSNPAPVEMTGDQRIRWVISEEQELLKLLPTNNGHAAPAEQHIRWLQQIDEGFIKRVNDWIEWAEQFQIDPSNVRERFEYNWSLVGSDITRRLYSIGDLLDLAPEAIRMEVQDQILVTTNRIRWSVGIGKPHESRDSDGPASGKSRPPKKDPPSEPPDPVGARIKR